MWILWNQTEAQYSAGATTSAVAEVRKVSNEIPQSVSNSFFCGATRVDTFCFGLCKWFLYVKFQCIVIPRYVGYCSQFRTVLGFKITVMDFKVRWFLRWNNDDTIFYWESFKC